MSTTHKVYLTKRILIRAIKKMTNTIEDEAMSIKGYVVKIENGWVVRVHCNGQRVYLKRLNIIAT